MDLELLPIYTIKSHINNNPIQQLLSTVYIKNASITPYQQGKLKGCLIEDGESENSILAVSNKVMLSDTFKRVLMVRHSVSSINERILLDPQVEKYWLRPIPLTNLQNPQINWEEHLKEIHQSWLNQLFFREEIKDENKEILQTGLRQPQVGAIHATLAHWTISHEPATIVMPTGTGKTDTMVALLIAKQCRRVLVVVPTDPLREQIAAKFSSFGILKNFGVIGPTAKYPIVGILKHKPKTVKDVKNFFQKCNVIVSTMSIVGGCEPTIQTEIARLCSHLFIDEAHHIAAPTWENFRNYFAAKPILQFTATPFRNDGKNVDGEIIYNYPLLKAQEEEYFKPISFIPVLEFSKEQVDAAIAKVAVEQLKKDLENGCDHILMARVKDISRTEEVYSLYKGYTEFDPVIIHSQQFSTEKKKNLAKIRNKKSRIIICVDMLGEGFDLPELKIAALHDIHKSLGVTLQFTGRFTRTTNKIGDATFVANIADPNVSDTLTSLYGENADWNKILRNIGTQAIQEQVDLKEFLKGFDGSLTSLPLLSIRPKMSTVIYKTTGTTWNPKNCALAFSKDTEIVYDINESKKLLVFVAKLKIPVEWGRVKEMANLVWDLYIRHYRS